MNRNQKIALGCGGGGCLGLILLVIVGVVLVVSGIVKAPGLYDPGPNRNYNYNANRTSNYNYNSNNNLNSNSDTSLSMSEDDKHKLFQAVGVTKDNELIQKVLRKIGLFTASGTPSSDYQQFMKDHFTWAFKNLEFIQSVNTPEKGRAYVEEHIDD